MNYLLPHADNTSTGEGTWYTRNIEAGSIFNFAIESEGTPTAIEVIIWGRVTKNGIPFKVVPNYDFTAADLILKAASKPYIGKLTAIMYEIVAITGADAAVSVNVAQG